MLKLSSDDTFHFEIMRVLSAARYAGADVAEVLDTASEIEPGNFESWHKQFHKLAERVEHSLSQNYIGASAVSTRDALFRAASYYRAADFFLHGNPSDPRINQLWRCQTEAFDRAISLLPHAGERFTLRGDGFDIPAIFYRASNDDAARPTLLMCNGYDGSQEEMLHVTGLAALERGINVLTFEGPGQPSVRREQDLGFIADWEQVVMPVVDLCEALPEVDKSRIGLLGYSMGGFLAARAAAFEHRLAAVICVDGVYDLYESFTSSLPSALLTMLEVGDKKRFNECMQRATHAHTKMRWAVEQGLWSFKAASAFDLIKQVEGMSLRGLTDRIKCPVLVCDAEHDRFFQGQPKQLATALGTRATLHLFTAEDAAGEHCHVGASALMNSVLFDWFANVVSQPQVDLAQELQMA